MTLQIIDWENETFSGKNLTNKKVDGFIKWIYEELGFQKSSDVYVKLCGNYTEFLKTIYKETARTKCVNADVKDLVQKNPIDQVYQSPVYEEWKQVNEQILQKYSKVKTVSESIHHESERSLKTKIDLTNLTETRRVGLSSDSWLRLYDYYIQTKIVDDEKYQKFREFVLNGVWEAVFLENAVIICKLPKKISFNKDGQLDDPSEDQPAIEWHDGTTHSYINGVCMDSLEVKPSKIEEILAVPNIEQRRALLANVDFEELEAHTLLRKLDESDKGNELYQIQLDADGEKIFPRFVKYKDPSTDRIYWSFVPDDILTADEGMALKFGLTVEEYLNLEAEG